MKKVILFMMFLILSIVVMGETLREMYDKSQSASREEIYNQITGIVSERDKNIKEIEEQKKNIKKEEFEKTVEFQKRKSEEEKKYNEEITKAKNEREKALKPIKESSYIEEIKCTYQYNADSEKMGVYFEKMYFEFPMKIEEAKEKKDKLKIEILYRINAKNSTEIVGVVASISEENTIIAVIEWKNIKTSKYVKVEGNGEIKDFIIGRYEVTQREYQSVMGYNHSEFKGDNLPVETVTWYDTLMYCNKLSEKEKLPKYYNIKNIIKDGNNIVKATVTIIGGKGYRLPTEEEWVWAAKGGKYSKGYEYSGSNDQDEVAWYFINSGDRRLMGGVEFERVAINNCKTHEVGRKLPNELWIYDMNGNVFEWIETSNLYSIGGAWNDRITSINNSQNYYTGDYYGKNVGFRVCHYLN